MLTLALLTIVVSVVLGLIESLPAYQLDVGAFVTNAQQIGAWASALNGYAPMVHLGAVLALLVSLKLALLLWQVVVFIYHQFWGSS